MTEFIEIRGARENNLKDVSLRIPKRKITIFTGVSGSGKSSIVFDTIATEAQRQLYENFSMFIRNFLPQVSAARRRRDREPEHGGGRRPEAAGRRLAFDRRHDHRHLRACCGCCSRAWASRHVGDANAFSFNDPRGHVPRVQRPRARRSASISDEFLDMSQIAQRRRGAGAVLRRLGAQALRAVAASSTTTRSCRSSRKDEMELLLHGKTAKFKTAVRRAARSTSPTRASSRSSSARTSSATSRRCRSARRKRWRRI